MRFKEGAIVAVDLDKTLCLGESFTENDCLQAIPIPEMIYAVNNKIYKNGKCFVIIYTARREFLRNATEFWLKKYRVRYHALVCGKLWANYYIDDRNVLIQDFLGGKWNGKDRKDCVITRHSLPTSR